MSVTILLTTTRRDDGNFGIAESAPLAKVELISHACIPPVGAIVLVGAGRCRDTITTEPTRLRRFSVCQRIDNLEPDALYPVTLRVEEVA